ncbi:hypothetical protein [Marinomonas ostreistagni]|uniref:Anti sigma-E protein RseA N-terminal domain-containing protein n=1 Tax=Marinomonas ostreistagni TaxID=359209 RepID=A0ABS0Z7S3_9GAMM|nr:hypothetical protein [Marinomonas ostreistagni]MBJ7549706.1 hypothetical protein [Marinomonas ostreistagni]
MSKFYDKHGSSSDDSLSAFLDNEATQADIDKLLASDPMYLAHKVDCYQDIHQALQPDTEVLISDSGDFLAQMHRKMEQITQESNVVVFPNQGALATKPEKLEQLHLPNLENNAAHTKRAFFSGLAVAASVAFVVVLGGNALLNDDQSFTSNNIVTAQNSTIKPAQPLTALSAEEALENNARLQNYLRQHAQQASMTVGQGMIPMAKVVGYPQGSDQ